MVKCHRNTGQEIFRTSPENSVVGTRNKIFVNLFFFTFARFDDSSIRIKEDRFTFRIADTHCGGTGDALSNLAWVIATQLHWIFSDKIVAI